MYSETIWKIKEYDTSGAQKLSKELNISPLLAALLAQRDIKNVEDGRNFLYGSFENVSDPYILGGMQVAVERIEKAIETGEKVIIYGDYDVDGVCSIVLLKKCLELCGGIIDYYVPDRFNEGYGLTLEAIETLATQGYSLLITVDCGISSVDEVNRASKIGMDVIVTDHHTPAAELPPAIAIINPKLGDDKRNYDLCGTGVAYQVARAICRRRHIEDQVNDFLDLVALATVADIVPLVEDNRILVQKGLSVIRNTKRTGLKALLKESGLEGKKINTWQIGFILAPRLNSAGRLESARISIELLLAKDKTKAVKLASQLCELNNERRLIEDTIFQEAVIKVEKEINLQEDPVIVVAGDGWHQGVIGIVASRLCDKYSRPAIIISWDGEIGRGSARSIPGINMYDLLDKCSSHLLKFGGHKMAAGLNIDRKKFEEFRAIIGTLVKDDIDGEKPGRIQFLDAEIEIDDINDNLLKELNLLQPYGEGNPAPGFIIQDIIVKSPSLVGKGKEHFKAKIGKPELDLIAFKRPELIQLPLEECYHDLAFRVEENEFRERISIQLKLIDIKPAYMLEKKQERTNLSVNIFSLVENIKQEIIQNRPVLLIYPTCRTLEKHQLILENYFLPRLIQPLHGKLPHREHIKIQEGLQHGQAAIFLITRAYLKYYLRRSNLPESLQQILLLWQDDIDDLEINNAIKGKHTQLIKKESLPSNLRWLNQSWQYDNAGRVLIYANRNQTVNSLVSRMANITVEAGVKDKKQRKAVRRKFTGAKNGVLLLDGGYVGGGYTLDNIDELVFADVPFSIYETLSIIDQIAAAQEVPISALFTEGDITSNRAFLNRLYPHLELIKSVLTYFIRTGKKSITTDVKQLVHSIEKSISQEFKIFDLLPVLHILVDLGLFQVKKKGSIIEIKFVNIKNPVLNISDSPYYLEGLVEKAAFVEWENAIKNTWYGDEHDISS
ncbi:MAG: single-stranded-DNA-specific exonuclease RecJ [Syntrophomonadaceae bacterium]|nr:single-stranded-DNA-specific exonuclease RecJ [Syntrophomonadaceae bacterium]MDD4548175.1 single-stranded-DNA-specific exonuclease RecJ [Syntrophomonadaceae bacterium]